MYRIDDRKSANPRMRGFLHGTTVILRERGLRGIYQGLAPTTAKQTANSAVRFGSYSTLRQMVQDRTSAEEELSSITTFAIGGISGLITVLVTQPLDTIKTRMQSIGATQYRNSFICGVKIVKDEGISTLWSGAMPRLARLVVSNIIVRFGY